MVKPIVIDTSIFIEYIRRGTLLEQIVESAVKLNKKIYVPVIVLGEIFSGSSMKKESERHDFVKMIRGMETIDINTKMAVEYGKLKRNKLALGNDAWIGACSLVLGADLATLNIKDFEKIKGLKLYRKINDKIQRDVKNQ